MKYALLIYEPAEALAQRTGPQAAEYWESWRVYTQAVQGSGLMTGGAGLEVPANATTVRLHDNQQRVQDGPFADTKEQLGGFYLLDAPSLDQALEWAAKCPALAYGGAVEVRPELCMPTMS